jgi:hypothetical protein
MGAGTGVSPFGDEFFGCEFHVFVNDVPEVDGGYYIDINGTRYESLISVGELSTGQPFSPRDSFMIGFPWEPLD